MSISFIWTSHVKYLHMRYLGILCDNIIFAPKYAIFFNFLKALEQSGVMTSQIIIYILKNVPCAFPNTLGSFMHEKWTVLVKIYEQSVCHKAIAWILAFLLSRNFQKVFDFRMLLFMGGQWEIFWAFIFFWRVEQSWLLLDSNLDSCTGFLPSFAD